MRFGLGAKFTVTVLLILAGTMAANTYYFVRASTRVQEQQLVERGHALGRLISLISPQAILTFDYLQLNDFTREVLSQPDVVYGVILTNQGVPISSSIKAPSSDGKTVLKAATPQEVMATLKRLGRDGELIHLEYPIIHNEAALGRFLVGMSRASLRQEVRQQLIVHMLLLGAVVMFLGMAIYAVFRFNGSSAHRARSGAVSIPLST